MADKFDPNEHSVSDLKHQPIAVVKAELPALAKALGVEPSELFRSLNPPMGAKVAPGTVAEGGDCRCCGNDSW